MKRPSKINKLLEALRLRPIMAKDFAELGYTSEKSIHVLIHLLREQGHVIETVFLSGSSGPAYYVLREVAGVFRERAAVVTYLKKINQNTLAELISTGHHHS